MTMHKELKDVCAQMLAELPDSTPDAPADSAETIKFLAARDTAQEVLERMIDDADFAFAVVACVGELAARHPKFRKWFNNMIAQQSAAHKMRSMLDELRAAVGADDDDITHDTHDDI